MSHFQNPLDIDGCHQCIFQQLLPAVAFPFIRLNYQPASSHQCSLESGLSKNRAAEEDVDGAAIFHDGKGHAITSTSM